MNERGKKERETDLVLMYRQPLLGQDQPLWSPEPTGETVLLQTGGATPHHFRVDGCGVGIWAIGGTADARVG